MKKHNNIDRTIVSLKDNSIKALEFLIKDINKLGKQAKISLTNEWFMVYTLIGTEGDYRGFKVIRVPTIELFEPLTGTISLKWVTLDLKHWIAGLGYLEKNGKLALSHVNGDENVFNIDIMDDKLTLSYGCDNPDSIRNIGWDEVTDQLAASACNMEISTDGETISKVKKLMKMSEDEIIMVRSKDGRAYMGTTAWSLDIGKMENIGEDKTSEYMIRGKYINSISSKSDNIILSIYENRVAVKDTSVVPSLYLFPLELLDI